MTLGQRVAVVALALGLVVVGAVDLLGREGDAVITTTGAAGVAAAEAAVGEGAAAASASGAPAVAIDPAAAAPTRAAAAAAVAEDDTGEEPEAAAVVTQPADAPASADLPANSGTGRRVVYTVKGHRVWLVDTDGSIVRTMLVTNRKFVPNPGTYKVFSKATKTINKFFPEISMEYMTRFAISPNKKNTIGFHAIPFKHGKPMQTEAQLGGYGSGGCVRMTKDNAIFVFNWAPVGTKVVVLA